MRELVVQHIVSLDGFSCDEGSAFQQYVFSLQDDELDEMSGTSVGRAGTHIMGRVTYEAMAAYWPTATGRSADLMNEIPKVVFSRTIEQADWPDSEIARGDTAEEVARLKALGGGEILAHGGVRFLQSLIAQDLADEIRLFVFPVAVGHGASIFATVPGLTTYDVVSSRLFTSGVVHQVLRRAGERLPAQR